jgi:hypothetical protein
MIYTVFIAKFNDELYYLASQETDVHSKYRHRRIEHIIEDHYFTHENIERIRVYFCAGEQERMVLDCLQGIEYFYSTYTEYNFTISL